MTKKCVQQVTKAFLFDLSFTSDLQILISLSSECLYQREISFLNVPEMYSSAFIKNRMKGQMDNDGQKEKTIPPKS